MSALKARSIRASIVALAGLALAGCAGASALAPPSPSAEAVRAEAARRGGQADIVVQEPSAPTYAVLRAMDRRVADVAYRLARANVELCREVTPQIGLTIHTLTQYGAEVRPDVAADIGESGAPAVLTVAQGSPAALAGVRADDILVSINGRPFAAGAPTASPRYDQTLAAQTLMNQAIASGPQAQLTVRRASERLEFTLMPAPTCLYDIQIETDAPPGYAAADKDNIFLGANSISFTRDDDELAILIGHELAHTILGHALSVRGQALGLRAFAESEADYLGLYLAARAGYEAHKAPAYLRRVLDSGPSVYFSELFHPPTNERVASLRMAAEEIAAKRRASVPLLPNRRSS